MMADYIDDYYMNRQTKLYQFIMTGDWRYKVDIIMEIEKISPEWVERCTIDYTGTVTNIQLVVKD